MLQLNRAKFSLNGNCGYVLKPQCMCQGEAPGPRDTELQQGHLVGQPGTRPPGCQEGVCGGGPPPCQESARGVLGSPSPRLAPHEVFPRDKPEGTPQGLRPRHPQPCVAFSPF